MFPRRLRPIFIAIALLLFASWTIYMASGNSYQIKNAISYSTRPLWDKPEGPKNIVPHYYAEGLSLDEHTCSLHGWKPRGGSKSIVFDAVLMSSELDLLEIRLNELDYVVDRFFIIESNTTFTGLPKEKYYDKNRERFKDYHHKISYRSVDNLNSENAWDNEAAMRTFMSSFIKSHTTEFPPDTEALVIMSDVDEIPSEHSIRLLKLCDFGQAIHLQLRNYVYSFEWLNGFDSWRASVRLWNALPFYSHGYSEGAALLADAGWHCSFCFRTINEFVVKMTGFSHHDRVGGRTELLDPSQIQQRICDGSNIFGMLPEAYTYLDLFKQLYLRPQTTMVGVPRFLIENAERFKFLLPGGCRREKESKSSNAAVKDSI
ncbi:glycosyltransferase family 17 protein [Marasmius fiardii PR-910]|nr:glycosyltransferase family 17 protein [Marasmius fiardii PR-910]